MHKIDPLCNNNRCLSRRRAAVAFLFEFGQTHGFAPTIGQTHGFAPTIGQTHGFAPTIGQTHGFAPTIGQTHGFAPTIGQTHGFAPTIGQTHGFAPTFRLFHNPAKSPFPSQEHRVSSIEASVHLLDSSQKTVAYGFENQCDFAI
jgi:hypothetical protein